MQKSDKKLSSEHKKKISLALMGNRHGVKNLIRRHSGLCTETAPRG